MVGDPSGRSEERNLLDAETLSYNVACISGQLSRLLDFSPGKYAATLVNNADWTAQVTALDFLRDVGKHITINQMLAKDSRFLVERGQDVIFCGLCTRRSAAQYCTRHTTIRSIQSAAAAAS